MPDPKSTAAARSDAELRIVLDDPGAEIEALSLRQALIDFEIANGRVVDLTHRLTEVSRELTDARAEAAEQRARALALETELASYRHSRALKLVRMLRGLIRLVRG